MKTNARILLVGISALATLHFSNPGSAAVIFSQDFSSSPNGPTSDYVSSTPNSGQWNAIGSSGAGTVVSVTSGALQYSRAAGNSGSFSRTTDFSPTPVALIYRFDLTVSLNTVAQTTAAQWQVGSGFGTGNSVESAGDTHSKFGINLTSTPGTFVFRDVSGSANSASQFSGSQSVMWVINNSGADLSYVGPDNATYTVANDKWDLWSGTTLALDERNATTASQSLTDLKFVFDGSGNALAVGTISMDNFSIEAVPEPTNIALGVFAVGLLAFSGARALRKKAKFGETADR